MDLLGVLVLFFSWLAASAFTGIEIDHRRYGPAASGALGSIMLAIMLGAIFFKGIQA
jgi:hypothetical protein